MNKLFLEMVIDSISVSLLSGSWSCTELTSRKMRRNTQQKQQQKEMASTKVEYECVSHSRALACLRGRFFCHSLSFPRRPKANQCKDTRKVGRENRSSWHTQP